MNHGVHCHSSSKVKTLNLAVVGWLACWLAGQLASRLASSWLANQVGQLASWPAALNWKIGSLV